MNSPCPRSASCSRRTLLYPDRLRHAQVSGGVQDWRPNVGFVHCCSKVREYRLSPPCLSRYIMCSAMLCRWVSTLLLPARESLALDFLENGVARVVVYPRDSTVAWLDGGTRPVWRSPRAAAAVASVTGRYLREIALDRVEQAGHDLAVAPGGGGHFNADDVLAGFVYGQIDVGPGATLARVVLTHFPFAFAEDLQARRIDHHVRRTLARPTRKLHRKLRCSWRQVGVVRHRQVQLAQSHKGLHQTFSGAIRQLAQRLDRQTGLDGSLLVQLRGLPWSSSGGVYCSLILASSNQTVRLPRLTKARSVIRRPVRQPIPLLQAHLASVTLHAHRHDLSPPTAKHGDARGMRMHFTTPVLRT